MSAKRASSTRFLRLSGYRPREIQALRDINQDVPAGYGFPPLRARCGGLLLILGRHARRQQRRERYAIATLRGGLELAGGGIAAGRLDDGSREDVFPCRVNQPALSGSEIGGTAALGMASRDLVLGRVGLLGQGIAVWQAVGPRHAARPIVLVQRFHPQIDRTRIAFHCMRIDDPRLQQLEAGGEFVHAGPTQQAAGGDEADQVERAGDDDRNRLGRPWQAGIDEDDEQQCADQRVADGQRDDDRLQAVHGRNIRTPVLGSRSAPLARTLRKVASRDFGRRCTSITLPSASSLKRNAVCSSPVWSTITLSPNTTCAVGLSFWTFTVASTGWPVVAWKCEMLTVYSPATTPRTVTISSRIGDGSLRPLMMMKSLAPPRSSRSSVRKPASRCRYQAILPIGSWTKRSRSSGWLSGQSMVMMNSALESILPSLASGEMESSAMKKRKAMTCSALNSMTLNGSNGSSRG